MVIDFQQVIQKMIDPPMLNLVMQMGLVLPGMNYLESLRLHFLELNHPVLHCLMKQIQMVLLNQFHLAKNLPNLVRMSHHYYLVYLSFLLTLRQKASDNCILFVPKRMNVNISKTKLFFY